jgi:hypothetical protein
MTKQTEALRMAIEWLDNQQLGYSGHSVRKACQEALAETQEPVLYIDGGGLDGHATWAQAIRCQDTDIALYTTPPRRRIMDDALEVLNELETLVKDKERFGELLNLQDLYDFIDNQRSIYQPARGECAV